MQTHLEQDLEQVKLKIFEMVDLTIKSIENAIMALQKADLELAKKVIKQDSLLDKLEVKIDTECIKILVTKQPTAIHLRFVLAMLKINTDLERIGDFATNISKETIRMKGKKFIKPLVDIPRMAHISIEMLKETFQAITDKKPPLARKVIKKDLEIDKLNIQIHRELFSYMAENNKHISQSLSLMMIAKSLERIGDHITNIAERAIYYIEGVDIRHKK